MLAQLYSCTTVGLTPYMMTVEVDVGGGLPHIAIVGLPDSGVRESIERVRTAIQNSGFHFPPRRVTINLAPADIKKEGTAFDLAIAVGILVATDQLVCQDLSRWVILGELSLDGSVRSVPGVLPMALYVSQIQQKGKNPNRDKNKKLKESQDMRLIVPRDNSAEVALTAIEAYGPANLKEVVDLLEGKPSQAPLGKQNLQALLENESWQGADLCHIKGQQMAKRSLEIAAAGGHNLLLLGAPGSGKSMLARCLPTILPAFKEAEALETSKIYSIAGLLNAERPLVTRRPFRAPHHSASLASIIGGGSIPRPGDITLAMHGVLFLDELPEYRRDVLEALRQPLEERVITLSRAAMTVAYPAVFQLIAAANPCLCGYYGDPVKPCSCSPHQVRKYRQRISGPLLDRIDIHVEVPSVSYEDLATKKPAETSAQVRARVNKAREKQLLRYQRQELTCNARMSDQEVKTYCFLEREAQDIMRSAFHTLGFSARAHNRLLKIARTIADLADSERIKPQHLAEAIQFRALDRRT